MCGIFCALSSHQSRWPTSTHQKALQDRGPDSCSRAEHTEACTVAEAGNGTAGLDANTYVTFCSTVLSLRGLETVQQPFMQGAHSSRLCWNGEAWAVNGSPTGGNDTEVVYDKLQEATGASRVAAAETDEVVDSANRIAKALSEISGPYAFVFHDPSRGLIYYGRDFLGRRSLLIKIADDGDVLISSVSDETSGWVEVEADGVYCIDVRRRATSDDSARIGHFASWSVPYCFSGDVMDDSSSVIPRLSLNKQVPQSCAYLTAASACVLDLEQHLRRSLEWRILSIPDPPHTKKEELGATLAILFSGGLDCTVLARLCHAILPATEVIDLLNVAFENPRIHKNKDCDDRDVQSPYELCPDRITGRASFAELQRVCPGRQWNFVAINIPYRETLEHRSRITALIHPHNTEMDLSIACALYFAARGRGLVDHQDATATITHYTTSARVLLSGLGADELFGGYQRHATAHTRNGFSGLLDELELDVGRLGKRNLGRDDRVIGAWGREARFPFLDEHLVAWALAVPVTEKCGFGEQHDLERSAVEDGSTFLEPGKKALRCLAWKLGMLSVAKEKKRAASFVHFALIRSCTDTRTMQIQFGARTAKMETGRTKGTTLLS